MQAELASVVTSAVRFLFAPDIQFDELDFSEKVSTHPLPCGHKACIDARDNLHTAGLQEGLRTWFMDALGSYFDGKR